jgi:hypothetical protein
VCVCVCAHTLPHERSYLLPLGLRREQLEVVCCRAMAASATEGSHNSYFDRQAKSYIGSDARNRSSRHVSTHVSMYVFVFVFGRRAMPTRGTRTSNARSSARSACMLRHVKASSTAIGTRPRRAPHDTRTGGRSISHRLRIYPVPRLRTAPNPIYVARRPHSKVVGRLGNPGRMRGRGSHLTTPEAAVGRRDNLACGCSSHQWLQTPAAGNYPS